MKSRGIRTSEICMAKKKLVNMRKEDLSLEQKRADKDLNIIICASLIPLILYWIFGNDIMNFAKTSELNIWIRFIPVLLLQFSLAGLGSLIVICYRKEKFKEYGLVRRDLSRGISAKVTHYSKTAIARAFPLVLLLFFLLFLFLTNCTQLDIITITTGFQLDSWIAVIPFVHL